MPRYAANLSLLFTELPFEHRFEAAAKAGFEGVEFGYPQNLSLTRVSNELKQHGLTMVMGTLPHTDVGDKGVAALPGLEQEFRNRLAQGVEAAVAFSCNLLHVTTGLVSAHHMSDARLQFARNIDYALRLAEDNQLTLLIEAINQKDVPDYFIRSLNDAVSWVEQIDSDRFKLLIDFYHASSSGVPVDTAASLLLSHGAHAQIAGFPGRAEPDTGDIDYRDVLKKLDNAGYPGWVGCEYKPSQNTIEGLSWRKKVEPVAQTPTTHKAFPQETI